MLEKTMIFSLGDEKDDQIKTGLTIVYDALRQKGYNPINQIVGYILSEDPPISLPTITRATSSARLTATICSKHWLNRTSMFKKG